MYYLVIWDTIWIMVIVIILVLVLVNGVEGGDVGIRLRCLYEVWVCMIYELGASWFLMSSHGLMPATVRRKRCLF